MSLLGLVDSETGAGVAATPAAIGAEPAQTPVTQAEAEAGTETGIRSWPPVRVRQAVVSAMAATESSYPGVQEALVRVAAHLITTQADILRKWGP